MNRFFTLLLAASCLTAVGQVTYQYNPDGNADGDIAVGDLQDFLVTYGNPFSPSEIMVGDSSLTYWVEQLSQTIQEQQEMIELLQYGNSKNLAFPDGFGGDFIVLNISDEDYTVPLDKNFFITNQYSQNALPRITVDDIPVFEVDGGTLATSQFGSGSTYIVGGGSVLGYTPIVNASPVVNFSGILVDRGVEPIVVDLLQEDFVVPQGYNLHLMSVYSEGSGSGFAQVDGIELFRMGSNSTMWQNLIGGQVIASGNQTVSLVSTGNLELANLSCYLAPIDHFGGPNNLGDSDDSSASDNSGPCQGEFTVNYHGHDYELVEIGDQCWFAENLQTTTYNNGDSIPYEILGYTGYYEWQQDPSRFDDFCVYGPYVSTSGIKSSVMRPWMGLAYSGFAAMNENLCPVGYRVPKTEDFQTLLGAPLNVSVNRGDLLDTPPWSFGTNLSGFSIRMHGNVTHTQCDDAGQRATLLTSDIAGDQNGSPYMNRLEAYLDGTVRISNGNSFIAWSHGGAIRCLKD